MRDASIAGWTIAGWTIAGWAITGWAIAGWTMDGFTMGGSWHWREGSHPDPLTVRSMDSIALKIAEFFKLASDSLPSPSRDVESVAENFDDDLPTGWLDRKPGGSPPCV